MPEGKHAIRAVSFGEFKGRGEKTVTPDLALNVITPVKVTVAPAAPLVVGQKQKVKISVTRFSDGKGDDPQPVTIKWKKLPGGVTGPEETTIAVDQNEIEVELAAAADATPGKFEELTVEAATKYQGQDIKVESPPASLEVKASE